jgi:hypothetical protein
MATIGTEEKECAVCGQRSSQGLVLDAERSGSADLDLRPPEDQRGTLAHWIQSCPHCGFCAPAIDTSIEGAADRVRSEEYRAMRHEIGRSELVTRLLCSSTLLEHADRWVEATETALWAAWAADDAGDEAEAVRARKRTLDLFNELRLRNEHYIEDPNAETLVMVDVARRAGERERAARLLDGLTAVDDPRFRAIVAFQRRLLDAGDTGRYTVADAIATAG